MSITVDSEVERTVMDVVACVQATKDESLFDVLAWLDAVHPDWTGARVTVEVSGALSERSITIGRARGEET